MCSVKVHGIIAKSAGLLLAKSQSLQSNERKRSAGASAADFSQGGSAECLKD